jgi:hydrogenase-4 component E
MLLALITLSGVLDMGMFLLTVLMHASRKTALLLTFYVAQSILVVSFFALKAFELGAPYLYMVALLTAVVKMVLVPVLFFRLIRRFGARFASDTYLSTPVTFAVLFILALFSLSALHASLPGTQFTTVSPVLAYAPLHLAGILSALFLAVNRKEALSQIIALLALENWIVFVATQ